MYVPASGCVLFAFAVSLYMCVLMCVCVCVWTRAAWGSVWDEGFCFVRTLNSDVNHLLQSGPLSHSVHGLFGIVSVSYLDVSVSLRCVSVC